MDPLLDLLYITVSLLCTPKLLLNAYSHPPWPYPAQGVGILEIGNVVQVSTWVGDRTLLPSPSQKENQNLWRSSTLSALMGKMPSVEVLLDVALVDFQSMLSIPLLGRDELLCDDASAFAVGAT